MKSENRNISLKDVSQELFNDIFQEALKDPLKGLFLTHYTEEEILEMQTKMVLVQNKKGQLKLAGMAIKNFEEEQDNGEYEKVYNEDGTNVKEATALFSVDFDSMDEGIKNRIYENLNSIVVEPDNYGKDGEPNLILSLLQQGILDTVKGTIKGSHFGTFLSSQYDKMGKEITNDEGWDFDYSQLSTGAQKSYIEYIQIQVSKMKQYKVNASQVKYDAVNNRIYINGKYVEESMDILNDINSKLKYYETVVKKDSVEFYRYGEMIKEITDKSILEFDEDFTLKSFVENTREMSFKEMTALYSDKTGKQVKKYGIKPNG